MATIFAWWGDRAIVTIAPDLLSDHAAAGQLPGFVSDPMGCHSPSAVATVAGRGHAAFTFTATGTG